MNKEPFKKALWELCLLNFIGLGLFTLSYFRYFILGGNLRSFLGVQKWVALFYANSNIDRTKLYGNYLSLIFLNKWRFWFGDYPSYPYKYWNIFWPITLVLGIISAYNLLNKKINKNKNKNYVVKLLISFLIIYNAFLFITPIYPRYLLLLFIPLNILISIYLGRKIEVLLKNF